MSRRHDCPSLRAAYAELLDLKKRCKLALEEAKRTGNIEPARKLISLFRKKEKELGKGINPFWDKVDVSYQMPSFEKLNKRFPLYVDPIFGTRPFVPIDSCKHISREPRKIRFECFQMDKSTTVHEVLAEMEKRGYRPALLEELFAFTESYSHSERMPRQLTALGSVWPVPHTLDTSPKEET